MESIEHSIQKFIGITFRPMDKATAVRSLMDRANRQNAFAYGVTPNVDHVLRFHRDEAFATTYRDAGWVLNDSRVLEILARLDGYHLPASPGADIVAELFNAALVPDDPITIIGGEAWQIHRLRRDFGLSQMAWHAPPTKLRERPSAIAAAAAFMAQHPAKFHFLCVGSPQQELVAKVAFERGDVTGVGLCCGASIDFLTQKVRRAPVFMRRARLEWLHRLASNPKRLGKRYLLDGPAIFRLWHRYRRQGHVLRDGSRT